MFNHAMFLAASSMAIYKTMNYFIESPDKFISMPWKNGLGHTVELIKEQSKDGTQFIWRLSMADVVADGNFSDFSGYDRILILLEGDGVTLSHENGQKDVLQQPLQVARFSGDEKTFAQLHGKPVKDFNVMTRRADCAADVKTNTDADKSRLTVIADILLVFSIADSLAVCAPNEPPITLKHHELLVVQTPEFSHVEFAGGPYISVLINYTQSGKQQ